MRLSAYIQESTDTILAEWETFARSLPSGASMDIPALRDHARDMLIAIAQDLQVPQSAAQQSIKARGRSDATRSSSVTAAQSHGADRAVSGFSIDEMVAEFRALRASVIRLWLLEGNVSGTDLDDMIRFNEGIDQAIAESIVRFSADVARTKERFLAILSHDLRTPLNAVLTSSEFMLERGELVEPYTTLLSGIVTSTRRMMHMVADLLDFTRTRLGDSMPLVMENADIRMIIHAVVSEIGAAHPDSVVQIETSGLLRGRCDPHRIAQALTNIIGNAVQHGSATTPIKVSARGAVRQCTLSVQSFGPTIPPERFATLLHPMSNVGERRHLGLGLYIADKIITAHGGSISVHSDAASGTTVEMSIPL